jgi:hypothetical protein
MMDKHYNTRTNPKKVDYNRMDKNDNTRYVPHSRMNDYDRIWTKTTHYSMSDNTERSPGNRSNGLALAYQQS